MKMVKVDDKVWRKLTMKKFKSGSKSLSDVIEDMMEDV